MKPKQNLPKPIIAIRRFIEWYDKNEPITEKQANQIGCLLMILPLLFTIFILFFYGR